MRHNKKFNHLSRKKGHREALLANLAISLIEHKRIFTTLAKAKALRVYAEPLITRSKKDDTQNRRLVFSYLQNKEAVKELFGVISEKVATRPGGYLRILKTGHRLGDNAEMAMIEFVDVRRSRQRSLISTRLLLPRLLQRRQAAPVVHVQRKPLPPLRLLLQKLPRLKRQTLRKRLQSNSYGLLNNKGPASDDAGPLLFSV